MKKKVRKKRGKLTSTQALKVFRLWRDACLRLERKPHENFSAAEVWNALLLSVPLLKRCPDRFSDEWAAPALGTFQLLDQVHLALEVYPTVRQNITTEERQLCNEVADKLDWALAMICQEVTRLVSRRAFLTRNDDLLFDALGHKIGDGVQAAALLRHIQRHHRDVDESSEGVLDSENSISHFAWDAYQRVAALDELADEFPNHLRPVVRRMHAWPMLRHRHTTSDARFAALAERLELGAEYPLDTRKIARFRPDSPMVRYLDGLIPRMHLVWVLSRLHKTGDAASLGRWWQDGEPQKTNHEEPSKEVIDVLRCLRDLPALTKATAPHWTRTAVMPIILATDARGAGPYAERALEQIRRQRDIKSRAIFESRMKSKVGKTLRSLARSD